jgi:hypothetical protein
VRCIIAQDGSVVLGRNDCLYPQPVCPREEGEGEREVPRDLLPGREGIGMGDRSGRCDCDHSGALLVCQDCGAQLRAAGVIIEVAQ